jgi:hypothetical protein
MIKKQAAVLKEIQSADIKSVYLMLTDIATQWAVCGFITQANHLLEKLWSFRMEHGRDTWLKDEGFMVFWNLTDKTPAYVPFEIKDIQAIEFENLSRLFFPTWHSNSEYTSKLNNSDWNTLKGNQIFHKGLALTYDAQTGTFKNHESQLNGLQAIEHFISKENPVGYVYFHAYSSAAVLAARNGLEEAKKYLVGWGKGYLHYSSNYLLSYLMRERSTAQILLSGVLAPVFGLNRSECENDFNAYAKALAKRIESGQSLSYENLSWTSLLTEISTKALELGELDFDSELQKTKWLGSSPATKPIIQSVEKRLGAKLPQEYIEFLLASNGFSAFTGTGPTILPAEQVGWLRDIEPELVNMWADAMKAVNDDMADRFSNSLLIGGLKEEQQLLLIPPQANEPNWECWFFATWLPGETRYKNFRYYMEDELQQLDQ